MNANHNERARTAHPVRARPPAPRRRRALWLRVLAAAVVAATTSACGRWEPTTLDRLRAQVEEVEAREARGEAADRPVVRVEARGEPERLELVVAGLGPHSLYASRRGAPASTLRLELDELGRLELFVDDHTGRDWVIGIVFTGLAGTAALGIGLLAGGGF